MQSDDFQGKRALIVLTVTIGIVALVGIAVAIKHKQGQSLGKSAPVSASSISRPPSSTSTTATVPATTTQTSTPVPAATTTPSCYTAAQAWNEEGQTGCVTFTGYAYTSYSGQMYLNQDSSDYSAGFSVWIPSGESFGSSLLNQYSGQPINVSGTIIQYDGSPEIEVTSASQIQAAN